MENTGVSSTLVIISYGFIPATAALLPDFTLAITMPGSLSAIFRYWRTSLVRLAIVMPRALLTILGVLKKDSGAASTVICALQFSALRI